jgi:DNA polymerase-3 subunit gamma/tau
MAKLKAATLAASKAVADETHDYTVLARRYRPQQFADLVGQGPVAQALVNALQGNRVAHAYLFTGARGVGKTSTARILAKALNCVTGPTSTPCDTCDMCRSIASGEDQDVLEIDGASNRGIDNIRELRGNVQYRPSRGRYKIYIIDEVHMLSRDAFNALLKTLEEPPPHVKFIFATTEVQKIPVTILSRCQRFDFAGIGPQRIVERLRQIVASEGAQAEPDALPLIARRAGGSMRDAQSLLDQLLAFGGERLTADEVHRLLGTAHDDRVAALAGAVLDHDPKRALDLLSQAADTGLQLGELLDQVIEYWRDLMVVNCAGGTGLDLSVTGAHAEALGQQAARLKLDTILAGLDVLVSTKARSRNSNHGRILLEMALVRLSRLDDLVSLSQLAQWLKQGDAGPVGPGNVRSGAPGVPARPPEAAAPAEAAKKKSLNGTNTSSTPFTPIPLTAASLSLVWAQVLAQVGRMLQSSLEKTQGVAISGPNTLVLRFPPGYNDHREHCQAPNNIARVEEALRRITGETCNLRIESASGAEAESTASATTASAEKPLAPARRLRDGLMRYDLIRRAVAVLGAQIVPGRTEEAFGAVGSNGPEPGEGPELIEA